MPVNWKKAQQKAAKTACWSVTMTKVRIRRVLSRTRWQLITFCGKSGGESVGVVDLLAVRKDHGKPVGRIKRGDALQLILIQVKGGTAAGPTSGDATRLRAVPNYITQVATWKKGKQARLFCLGKESNSKVWSEVTDLDSVFR